MSTHINYIEISHSELDNLVRTHLNIPDFEFVEFSHIPNHSAMSFKNIEDRMPKKDENIIRIVLHGLCKKRLFAFGTNFLITVDIPIGEKYDA